MEASRFGRYEVIRNLGRGGMATVYLARDPRVGRLVAIKVLDQHLAADPGFRARFEREAQLIAAMEHHAIVPLYDHGEENGESYLVFRYMEGGSLADLLHNLGTLPLDETARIVGRVAEALDYAHRRGVIHRDIKPANILFDLDGNAFLGDFGVARMVSGSLSTVTNAVIGTPSYMSPEQAEGNPATPASDLYALGCTTYEMLAGRPPFTGESPVVTLIKHVREAPPFLDGYARETDIVVRRAMAKEPGTRWRTGKDFATALAMSQALGTPPEAWPTRVASPTAPATRKNRSLKTVRTVAGIAVLALLLGIAGSILALRPSGEPAATSPADAATTKPVPTRAAALSTPTSKSQVGFSSTPVAVSPEADEAYVASVCGALLTLQEEFAEIIAASTGGETEAEAAALLLGPLDRYVLNLKRASPPEDLKPYHDEVVRTTENAVNQVRREGNLSAFDDAPEPSEPPQKVQDRLNAAAAANTDCQRADFAFGSE
jgi:serine/threonine protein kinase